MCSPKTTCSLSDSTCLMAHTKQTCVCVRVCVCVCVCGVVCPFVDVTIQWAERWIHSWTCMPIVCLFAPAVVVAVRGDRPQVQFAKRVRRHGQLQLRRTLLAPRTVFAKPRPQRLHVREFVLTCLKLGHTTHPRHPSKQASRAHFCVELHQ